jgi:hypothetical protein
LLEYRCRECRMPRESIGGCHGLILDTLPRTARTIIAEAVRDLKVVNQFVHQNVRIFARNVNRRDHLNLPRAFNIVAIFAKSSKLDLVANRR